MLVLTGLTHWMPAYVIFLYERQSTRGKEREVRKDRKVKERNCPSPVVCVRHILHIHTLTTVVKLWYDVCIMCFLVNNGIITMCNHSAPHVT